MAQTFKSSGRKQILQAPHGEVLPCLVGLGEDGAADSSEPTPGMVTRWAYEGSRYHRPHDAYLVNGIWCEVRNVPTGFGPERQAPRVGARRGGALEPDPQGPPREAERRAGAYRP